MINPIYGNIGIDILRYTVNDVEYFSPVITFFLDKDGKDAVSIPCEIRSREYLDVLEQCLGGLSCMFSKLSASVSVFDASTGAIIEELNLNIHPRFSDVEKITFH